MNSTTHSVPRRPSRREPGRRRLGSISWINDLSEMRRERINHVTAKLH
jgi:hypothetical protein